ncbi:hypothetical protein D2V08_12825 [Flagellimonas lutimaris]|uniref:Uncharacterized protein n=1 Tax=Flagellimonas lutimaris TaxID=475082 RepID=A0A3A1N735_9FLAO|nr:hypothetical protein D2V08_12825 [Allomuricauda lutimaris]
MNQYLEGIKGRLSPNDFFETLIMKIIGIDIKGKIVIAKIDVPMSGNNQYVYLSLANVNDDWKIVKKPFHTKNK